MNNNTNIKLSLQILKSKIIEAEKQFDEWIMSNEEDWIDPAWIIESLFIQLLIITEYASLDYLRGIVYEEYVKVKNSKKGFVETEITPDGEPFSKSIGRLRLYALSLNNMLGDDKITTFTRDLLQIIRNIHYPITDVSVFNNTPENENDVHVRIEAILKCVFPDLKHKPVLNKQIKNFIPDTGIPSLRTLIEYKFLSSKNDVGIIADQLLADTRGYVSRDWSRFLYVIYETNRFRTEDDWNLFLREAEVPNTTSIVVLNGEPSAKRKISFKKK